MSQILHRIEHECTLFSLQPEACFVQFPKDFRTDLPTHPLFSGDTRILQGSPAHPRRIASHPHPARLKINASAALNNKDEAISYRGNFRGRKLARIDKKYDFRGENSRGLLTFAALRMPRPQISQRNLRK